MTTLREAEKAALRAVGNWSYRYTHWDLEAGAYVRRCKDLEKAYRDYVKIVRPINARKFMKRTKPR